MKPSPLSSAFLSLLASIAIPLAGCEDDDLVPLADGSAATDARPGDGGGTSDAGADASADAATTADTGGADAASTDGTTTADVGTAGDAAVLTGPAARGQYLVGVLGCNTCHTPRLAAGGFDTSKFLSGAECFVKDMASGGCLNTANLTPDETGIKNDDDAKLIDAIRTGKDPDDAGKYLFAQMPYYQFANLGDDDAKAIVAYLRTLTPVSHKVPDNSGPYAVRPSAAEWSPAPAASLPAPGAGAPAGAANGKYLASIMCVTCHTVDVAGAMPKHVDVTKAFQGGKPANTTVMGMMKMIQSANLTPDMTGLKGWSTAQIVTALKTGKDEKGNMICSPMRTYPTMTDADATDIASYLLALPPAANAITMTCE
jgi:mono/diheme cytochrome c family protein